MKNFWQRSKKWIIALVVVVGLLIGVVGALWATNIFGWRAWRVQEVEHFIGASLPQGAANIQFSTNNLKTRLVLLRFDIPADVDLSTFITRAGIQKPLRPGFTPFPAPNPLGDYLSWWDVQTATDFAGLYNNDGQKITEILLDNSRHTVFMRAYALSN